MAVTLNVKTEELGLDARNEREVRTIVDLHDLQCGSTNSEPVATAPGSECVAPHSCWWCTLHPVANAPGSELVDPRCKSLGKPCIRSLSLPALNWSTHLPVFVATS